jgi:type IV pilus assembly protein PilY1
MKTSKKTVLGTLSLAGAIATTYMLVYAAASFDPELAPVGYVGMPAVSNYDVSVRVNGTVTATGSRLYAIDYSSLDWSGNLHSYALSATGAVSEFDDWDDGAAHQIELQDWNTGRKIVTVSGGVKVPFRWASLSNTHKTALDSATAGGAASSPVLDYIRGDRSNEKPNGKNYRARTSLMGDIIHSSPIYCKAGDCTAATVFVGANDGMLHAINATDGSERFAYIPSMLIPKLPLLKSDPYLHKYFVDGRLDVRKFGATTILAGALGAGGRGLFALNVTNAVAASEADAASKILWEITNATTGYANLGHVYGQPWLATLPDGTTNAVIAGNGYNNTGNGRAVLYVINASTGAKIAEIDTGSGSAASPNGLSSPTLVDTDYDGDKDVAYAGDIDGNLWKFDLSTLGVTKLHAAGQAITMAPAVKQHPNGGYMVMFVTGRMFADTDKIDASTHYAYGIWDGAPVGNTTLLAQTLTEANYEGVSPAIRVRKASANVPNWAAGGHKGWRTPLPGTPLQVGGERVVGDGANLSDTGQFVFLTTNPTINPTATPPGENWLMQINPMTGGDNGAIRFDLNGDTLFTSADQLTDGSKPVGRYIGGGVRSQLIQLSTAYGFDVYHANYDRNGDPPEPPATDDPGVSGGHFDPDIYYFDGTSYKKMLHVHEYDDKYNVTGVNMLNASNSGLNLSPNVIASATATTPAFKVLVMNQFLNPAAKLSVGGAAEVNVKLYNNLASEANATTLLAGLPTYTRANITTLVFNLPLDAFKSKDWWGTGDGVVRAGLIPNQTGCVDKVTTAGAAGDSSNIGPNGERHGARH